MKGTCGKEGDGVEEEEHEAQTEKLERTDKKIEEIRWKGGT